MKPAATGFALLTALWTLVVLSAIALSLAAAVGTEVRAGQESWNDLQAEFMAKSGHELATYLEARSLGTPVEDLAGLPVQPLIPGLRYRIAFETGTVDIALEGENGKFDLGMASEEDAAAFLSNWTGDPVRSREIAAGIADWIDVNDEPRPFGAESAWYLSRGYRPRNANFGQADLLLLKGTTRSDFVPTIADSDTIPGIRAPLTQAISAIPTGRAVNPNYAPPFVLRAVPGMTADLFVRILAGRQNAIFTSRQDFQNRTGLSADSALLNRLIFDRGTAPAVLAVARLQNSTRIRAERRTRIQQVDRRRPGVVRFVSSIERTMPVE
jgi:general secretion pathway protein K